MRLKRIILIIATLFIVFNIFLVVKDKNNKVNRISYIKEWTVVEEEDMFETLLTNGVLDYNKEQQVYLDEDSGSFDAFVVNRGDVVHIGDDLYTYEVQNYYEMKSKLESEISRLTGETEAVKVAIDKMQNSNIEQSMMRFVYPDDTEAANIPNNTTGAKMMKDQYIIDKEKEKGQLEAQLKSVESQLADLTAGESTIIVSSPYDGKVTNVSKTLDNPIITIESPELHVIGELAEGERLKVEKGMIATINLAEEVDGENELLGAIHNVSEEPIELELKKNSIYPFDVAFNEEVEQEGLLQGYHVNIEVTLLESLSATVVDEDVVHENAIWKMTPAGKLIKQRIEKGIEMNHLIEVTEGAEKADWIAEASENNFRDQATFITPLKPSKAKWKDIYKNGPRKRSILVGLLGR